MLYEEVLIMKRKAPKKFTVVMKNSLSLVFVVIILAFVGVFIKLIYIVNVKGNQYTQAVLSQQAYSSKVIKADRGEITDRNGIVLAKTVKTYNLVLDCRQLMDPKMEGNPDINNYYVEPSVNILVDIFGYDKEELLDVIQNNAKRSNYIFDYDISYDKMYEYNKYKSEHKFITGVNFDVVIKRVYPYKSFASHVIGFVNSEGEGNMGLEKYYDAELAGVDGMEYGYYDQELNSTKNRKEAINGNSLVTTIDYNIQTVIEKKIKDFRENTGCNNIGIIVMDPNKGEVLGMASNQEFDLNDPGSLEGIMSDEEYEENSKTADGLAKISEARSRLWRNFCVSDSYEPGSTFKSVTVASALEESVIRTSDSFYCGGYTQVDVWRIGCNNKSGHGYVSTAQALMKSCNCALMEIADKLGPQNFLKYQRLFGFGEKTGIDLPSETTGILIPEKNFHITELATSSFGTTFNVSPIQMASAYCSLINGGTYYKPHVVKEIRSSVGTVVEKFDNMAVRETISEETSAFIRDALYETVMNGTAKPAQVAGYLVGGKTGTAQKRPRDQKKYIVSFCGFAPIDNPQVMMYVVIDEIHDEAIAGSSSSATRMTSEVFKEILPYLGLYPDGDIEYIVDEELVGKITPTFDEGDEVNTGVIPDEYQDLIEE